MVTDYNTYGTGHLHATITLTMHVHKIKHSTEREKAVLDRLIYPIGMIFPLSTIPQIVEIFVSGDASGVSLLTWGAYAVLGFILLLWAIADSIKPLIISYSLWMLMYIAVLIGVMLYG